MTFLPQTLTNLRLLDSALLEGARAWVMGTVMSVFTPVTLVGTPHAWEASRQKASKERKGQCFEYDEQQFKSFAASE